MRKIFLIMVVLVVWAWGVDARAAMIGAVSLAEGAGAGGEGGVPWEMMAVDLGNVAGEVQVGVQDVRGGVQVVRRVRGNVGRVWLALPLVGRAGLANNVWPVEVVVRAAGKEVERRRVEVALGAAAGRRVVVPVGAGAGGINWWGPAAVVEVSEEEIVAAPALVFAGCEVVVLTPQVLERMSEERALALIGVGVRLVVPGEGMPAGKLSGLVWERMAGGWVVPAEGVRRPSVVEVGLAGVVEKGGAGGEEEATQRAVASAVVWVGPVAVVMVILVRGMFRRRRTVLLGSAVALVALTAGVWGYLQVEAGGSRETEIARWRMAKGASDAALGGIFVEEKVVAETSLFGGRVKREAGEMILPVAGTVGGYWGLRDFAVEMGDGGMVVSGELPARGRVFLEERRVAKGGLVPAFPKTAEERVALAESQHVAWATSHWLVNGYVYPADFDAGNKVLLDKWAGQRPGKVGEGLRAWEEMRAEAGHRYFLVEREGAAELIDFGAE